MQDRFKFRVWLKDTNKMYNVHSLHIGTNKAIISSRRGNVSIYINKNSILMQSTGLKDKNGKLVYEGDIVKDLIMSEIFYIVKWFNSGFYLESTITGSFLKFDDTQQEVIGNIYDDPELLERNNDKITR